MIMPLPACKNEDSKESLHTVIVLFSVEVAVSSEEVDSDPEGSVGGRPVPPGPKYAFGLFAVYVNVPLGRKSFARSVAW